MPAVISSGLHAFQTAERQRAVSVAVAPTEQYDALVMDAAEEEQILVQVHTSINMADAIQRAADKRKQPATGQHDGGPSSSTANSRVQPVVGGLALVSTMDEAGSSKRARAAGFEAPPNCKYHKLTQQQLKTAAQERGLVGRGPGLVPESADKKRLHAALLAYDATHAGTPGT